MTKTTVKALRSSISTRKGSSKKEPYSRKSGSMVRSGTWLKPRSDIRLFSGKPYKMGKIYFSRLMAEDDSERQEAKGKVTKIVKVSGGFAVYTAV